jgi:hypothetical protein
MAILLLAVIALVPALPVLAACPQNIAECLGAADGPSIVADKVTISKGSLAEEGYVAVDGADILGDTCALRGSFAGPNGCYTDTVNLILAAPDGIAAKFGNFNNIDCSAGGDIGVRVTGDIVTGGGAVAGSEHVFVNPPGIIDPTGGDSRVGTCAQAVSDMHNAAATFAALTPTRDLGTIRHYPSADGQPNGGYVFADPGVNVWTAESISIKSRRGPSGSTFDSFWIIELDPATEAVIINVKRVNVGMYSGIYVNGGDAHNVVLNILGRGSLRTRGDIAPRIVAGDGSVTATFTSYVGNGALARRVTVLAGYFYSV